LISNLIYTLVFAVLLYVDVRIFLSGHDVLGFTLLFVVTLGAFVYAWKGAYAYRYLFPSLMAFGVFVLLPLIYTIYIAFTNYSAFNLLSFRETQTYFRRETQVTVGQSVSFKIYPDAEKKESEPQFRIVLQGALATAEDTNVTTRTFLTDSFKLPPPTEPQLEVKAAPVADESTLPKAAPLVMRDIIKIREPLKKLRVHLDGQQVAMISMTAFAPSVPVWVLNEADNSFSNRLSGEIIRPDYKIGYYVNSQGQRVGPGFRVMIGFKNFMKIFQDESIRGPFMTIFIWTVLFALFSVLLTFSLGFLLAVILEWKALRGRKLLRSLLILPYAVPAFISILIFKGLFNPQFGEINTILFGLFGIRPEWTTDPFLARTMILIVNLWLGYPYMMILCTGILQSVPSDIYEASAIDGGGPVSDLFKMTLPLILPPLKPLLIASFAFNFNNFLLIYLLTNGAPQMVGAQSVVGYTDILVTYTFNLAFRDSGSNFGFASAIATIIFIIVSILSYVNLKAATRKDEQRI
jgi:maltose/maltodextrin transport system permease protein